VCRVGRVSKGWDEMLKITRLTMIVVVLFAACTSPQFKLPATPTAPTGVAPTPPPPRPVNWTLSGIIRVDATPVAGAKVSLLTSDGGVRESLVTDGSGSYRFTAVEDVLHGGALVSVARPGFFTETRYVPLSEGQTSDFELARAEFITVGETVQRSIGSARCASTGYGGGAGALCRRLVLTAPASGTLSVTVTASPEQPFDLSVLRSDGAIGAYIAAPRLPLQITTGVDAGSVYQIDVVPIGGATRDFELKTQMK
jgi:hypothetical protein